MSNERDPREQRPEGLPQAEDSRDLSAENFSESERAERIEQLEAIIDARLEKILRDQLKKINEGNAGVILKLNFDDVPADVVKWLGEKGVELADNQVAKILKIYSRGTAKLEFDLQQRAYEALLPYQDDPTVAKVPRPHFWRELPLTSATREFMRKAGIKATDRVEIIMMDFVPGEDVATKLMKELMIKGQFNIDEAGGLAPEAREASYPELVEMGAIEWVGTYLGWKQYAPGPGERLTPEEIQARTEKANDLNEAKIYKALYDRGMQIHPSVVTQIEKAMRILHEHGIVFRDGHQRNFMVDGDWSARAAHQPKVMLIDFGAAASFEGDYANQEEELYRAGDKGYINDFNVARKLKKLTSSPESRGVRTPAGDFAEKLEIKRAQLEAAKPPRFLNDLKGLVGASPEDVFQKMPGQIELKIENTLIGLKVLIEQGAIDEDVARAWLEEKRQRHPGSLADKIGWFLESL